MLILCSISWHKNYFEKNFDFHKISLWTEIYPKKPRISTAGFSFQATLHNKDKMISFLLLAVSRYTIGLLIYHETNWKFYFWRAGPPIFKHVTLDLIWTGWYFSSKLWKVFHLLIWNHFCNVNYTLTKQIKPVIWWIGKLLVKKY